MYLHIILSVVFKKTILPDSLFSLFGLTLSGLYFSVIRVTYRLADVDDIIQKYYRCGGVGYLLRLVPGFGYCQHETKLTEHSFQ